MCRYAELSQDANLKKTESDGDRGWDRKTRKRPKDFRREGGNEKEK